MTPEILPQEASADVERLRRLEELLDRQFTIAGVNFGIDSVIGLVPVVGDLITGSFGFYMIQEARRHGISKYTFARMYTNWGSTSASARSPPWATASTSLSSRTQGICAC